jgi:hypothetical protein
MYVCCPPQSKRLMRRFLRKRNVLSSIPVVGPNLCVEAGLEYKAEEKTRARMEVFPHPERPMRRIFFFMLGIADMESGAADAAA